MEDQEDIKLGVEEENEEFQPFDPELISIDTKPITMDTCLRRLEQGTIVLNPDFQRNEVWSPAKKCQLIESLMLKIPIPMFYVSADEKGTFNVVDGLQRLSTIRSYVLGDKYLKTKDPVHKGRGFKLEKLEFWGDQFNGLVFADLPIYIQNRILETGFTFTIINPGTPEEVKRNIFKRINTGGEPLTTQEIRHALYIGEATKILKRLAGFQSFKDATLDSVRSNRMMDRELVLRFIAFLIRSFEDYPKSSDMDKFLSDTMRIINAYYSDNDRDLKRLLEEGVKMDSLNSDLLDNVDDLFNKAMIRAKTLFGDHTFRKSILGNRKAPINKSLFEVWSVLLAQISEEKFERILIYKKRFLLAYYEKFESLDFIKAVSRDSWKYASVEYRYKTFEELLKADYA